ncbi:MAG TPA: ATP-binding protein [Chitinophagaceae bacterium]|nr:ATP-binding protein [Chitinophagaceae bacterium]
MKVVLFFLLILTGLSMPSTSQQTPRDSLKLLLEKTKKDTSDVKQLIRIADSYFFTKPDSCRIIGERALQFARVLHFQRGEVQALNIVSEALRFLGDYPGALKMNFEALALSRKMKDPSGEARSLGFIGTDYVELQEYRQALIYMLPAIKLDQEVANLTFETFHMSNTGNAYDLLKMPDSALYFQKLAYEKYSGLEGIRPLKSLILTRLGNAYLAIGKKDSALSCYQLSLLNSISANDRVNRSKTQHKIAELFEGKYQFDSSLFYARQAFASGTAIDQKREMLEASVLLVRLFREFRNPDSALHYQGIVLVLTDSLYGPRKFKQLQMLMLNEQQRQQEIVQREEAFRNKIKFIALLGIIGVILLLAFLLLRNNRQQKKANTKIEKAYKELKSTQAQLIQSEKMASLGEMSAGIAHEIQNPLNFVNNFSEVNAELIDEWKEETAKGNMQLANKIADDIKENLNKTVEHGKRADAIVKGMLQHTRSGSSVKEPTDINALADEYFRLAYHGLRAKDHSFNVTMKTDFDASIGKINIVPQDIGRVILNLITNAFYAVNEKCLPPQPPKGGKYEPIVTVATKSVTPLQGGRGVMISVKDNGNGIPQKVLDKIFQPFFTTKPTGQGTGLGLSLSYDIVKAHGGELKVETKEGEGTAFIIYLRY